MPLTNPILVYNVDGTANEAGMITEITNLVLHHDSRSKCTQFAVKQSIILGYNWLCNHNPEINWQTKEVKMSHCPQQCSTRRVENKHVEVNDIPIQVFPTLVEEIDNQDEPNMGVRATLTVLMNNSSLNIKSGEIQSKYISETR
jgi:hypothetical protein